LAKARWSPGSYTAFRPYLAARGRITAALRAWFVGRGFSEVETPALQVSPGNETHLHAFATELVTTAANSFLQANSGEVRR